MRAEKKTKKKEYHYHLFSVFCIFKFFWILFESNFKFRHSQKSLIGTDHDDLEKLIHIFRPFFKIIISYWEWPKPERSHEWPVRDFLSIIDDSFVFFFKLNPHRVCLFLLFKTQRNILLSPVLNFWRVSWLSFI